MGSVAPAFDLNTIPRCAIPMKQEVCEKTGFVLRRRGNITLEVIKIGSQKFHDYY